MTGGMTSESWEEEPEAASEREAPAITMRPIGVVRNGQHDLARADWSKVESRVELRPELEAVLLGLRDYSHVIVLGWLDQYPIEYRERPTAYPAGADRLPLQGSLALRGARPNPIAVTVCELRRIEGATLVVRGLDLVDGTPILDVKPYIAAYDAVPKASLPRWARG